MTAYLDVFHLVALTGSLLGHEPQVRDVGLLDAALARPKSSRMGVEAYPTLDLKAAALLDSIVSSRAFADGNKRAGLVAVFVFYGLNGHDFDAPHDELYDLIVAVADGSGRDIPTIAAALAAWRKPLGR